MAIPRYLYEMPAELYKDAEHVEIHANSTTPFMDPQLPSKELYDELSSPPSRRARKNRTSLAGWFASAILGFILLWSFLPVKAQDTIFFFTNPQDPRPARAPRLFTNHFVFGDSYSTTVFNVSGEQPSAENPLGNTNNTKPTWINFMVETYNTTVQRTYNLAVGGSTVDNALVQPRYMGSTSLRQQVREQFLRHYVHDTPALTAPWCSNDTLFSLWFGINDVVISAGKMQLTPLDRIFDSYRGSMQMLYDAGARHFLLLNIPPIDLVYLSYDTTSMRSDIASFNSRLLSLRLHFLREHPDAHASVFDVHDLYLQVIRRPEAFEQTAGLKNTTEICPDYLMDQTVGDVYKPECGVPLSQYFWQNLHTTAAVHNVTAAFIARDCFGERLSAPRGYCS